MTELGEALRGHPTPGGDEVPPQVLSRALDSDRKHRTIRRPEWLRGPLAVVAGLALLVPAGWAIAEGVQNGPAPTPEERMVQSYDQTSAALDAMWLDAALKAEAGLLRADVDPEQAAATFRAALHPPGGAEANALEDDMIALTETLRQSGDLPDLGTGDGDPWGLVAQLADPVSMSGPGSTLEIDPEDCPAIIAAFESADLDPPLVCGLDPWP